MKNAKSFELRFTDEEAITLYLFGIHRGLRQISTIHRYASDHLRDWFPHLPGYQKFNERLNRLNEVMSHLVRRMIKQLPVPDHLLGSQEALIDSMPIMMARGKRADTGKVAPQLADKGLCSTKNTWFHGVRLHQLGICNPGALPIPFRIVLSPAAANDNTVFKDEIAPSIPGFTVWGDKIYDDRAAAPLLIEQYQVKVLAVIRRRKGQKHLHPDQKYFNSVATRIRQPIESFFNWLQSKTDIQLASKVRSTTGLFKHIWGRIAAALLAWINIA